MERMFETELLKAWGLPWYGAVQDEVHDTGRWHEYHALVFKAPDDGLLYRVFYATGLTELQEMRPWDDEDPNVNGDGTVKGVHVEPVETVVIEYQVVR